MKKTVFFGLLALLAFGFTTCDTGGDKGNTEQKSLKITGLPGGYWGIYAGIDKARDEPAATGWASLKNNETEATLQLKKAGSNPEVNWTGNGEHIIYLVLQKDLNGDDQWQDGEDAGMYFYSAGDPIPQDMSTVKKVDFNKGLTTVAFDQFVIPQDDSDPVKSAKWASWKSEEPDSTIFPDVTVAAKDGVATINVTGTALSWGDCWKSQARYTYTDVITPEIGKKYKFVFEAWTETGTRDICTEYYWNHDEEDDWTIQFKRQSINETPKTITLVTPPFASDSVKLDEQNLSFYCADKIGTFYVKMISVTETTDEPGPMHLAEYDPIEARWYNVKTPGKSSACTIENTIDPATGVNMVTVEKTTGGKWDVVTGYVHDDMIAGKRYKYEFEAWTKEGDGSRVLLIESYRSESLKYSLPIDETRKTYTLTGKAVEASINGDLLFFCGDRNGTFYIKMISITETTDEPSKELTPEELPDYARWSSWANTDAGASITSTVDSDGVNTVTVGAAEEPWEARASYTYSIEAGKRYKYEFEAWTDNGSRTIRVVYYGNNDTETWLLKDQPITTEKKTYSFVGKALPESKTQNDLSFEVGDKDGTFHVKIISITETDEPTP